MNVEQPDAGNNQAKMKTISSVNHTDTNNQNTKIDSQDKKITLLQINNLMLIKQDTTQKPSAPVSDTVTNNQNDKTDNQAKKMTLLKINKQLLTKQDTKNRQLK